MRRGFTLFELLIAMSIVMILMSISLPIYSVVRRSMQQASTQFVLRKVDAGLRQFKVDWLVYPGQMDYPASEADLTNRLWYHIGTDISQAKRTAILQDAEGAGNLFNFVTSGAQPSPLTYTAASVVANSTVGNSTSCAILLNRMGRERARLAAVTGNLWLRGPVTAPVSAAPLTQDLRAIPFYPSPQSLGGAPPDPGPGWACDYLAGELDARFKDGNAVLDVWGRPLVYICQVIPGVLGSHMVRSYNDCVVFKVACYGLGPMGFNPADGPGPNLATSRPHLLYGGRVVISTSDAGDKMGPTPTDATWFPSLAEPMGSDIRYYATRAYAREFELWSGGPNRAFGYMRNAPANRDNLACTPYNREYR